jgi:tripartite-type tricarboxylate transporter receptor subunit TctC
LSREARNSDAPFNTSKHEHAQYRYPIISLDKQKPPRILQFIEKVIPYKYHLSQEGKVNLTKKMKCLVVMLLVAVVPAQILMTAGNVLAANWPEKGKLITLIVPYGAGGGSDMIFRAMQPFLEAELGTKFVVVNKPGGGSQIGTTEFLSKAGTDGYTLLNCVLSSFPAVYLDPDRKAPYGRKDFQLITNIASNSIGIAVKKGSRYKSLKDLVAAAKANPGKVLIASTGPMSTPDVAIFAIEKAAGVKFGHMFFDGQGEMRAALLGGHIDGEANPILELVPGHKSGEIEVLVNTGDSRFKGLPDVMTAEEQGYKAFLYSSQGLTYKAGTPKEIVDTMAAAVKRISENPEFQKLSDKMAINIRIISGKEYDDFWSQTESLVGAALTELRARK